MCELLYECERVLVLLLHVAMKLNFNAYTLVKSITKYLLLLLVIGFSFYYTFDRGTLFFLPDQSLIQDQDPLDDAGRPISPAVAAKTLPALQSPQSDITDAQKYKVMNVIKANSKISDAKKQEMMRGLEAKKN